MVFLKSAEAPSLGSAMCGRLVGGDSCLWCFMFGQYQDLLRSHLSSSQFGRVLKLVG